MRLVSETPVVMRKIFFLLLLIPLSLFAQVTDDFSDGDFTQNPTWTGSTSKFIVNDNEQLQLNSEEAGTAYLSLPIVEYESMEWQFWLREAFAPSGNNYTDVWLCADKANLTQARQGYFLRFGEAGGNDAIVLFRKDGNMSVSVCSGREGAISASFAVSVRVTCDREGNWMIHTCYDDSGIYLLEAEGRDETLGKSGWFGLCSTFTMSNAKKVYFDDIYVGPYIADHNPPVLRSWELVDPSHLKLIFDETLDEATALNTGNYWIDNGWGHPWSVSFGENQATILLDLERDIVLGVDYTLRMSGIKDLFGNTIVPATLLFFLPDEAAPDDIVINEILFNPIAPGVDYVELYNNSEKTIDLSTLLLGVVKESFPNPPDTILKEISANSRMFPPHTYVLLSTNSETVGWQYGCPTDNYVQMASFPAYPNAGGTALLKDKDGTLIDAMAFFEQMHYPLLKETKGVSLERVNFSQPSMDANNWHSAAESVHFGTPGQPNSMMQTSEPSQDEVAISPDIFSPDGDGFDDECFINYRFDEAGYTMNVYIFNVAGQLLRHLVKGEMVGQEGSLLWNGLDGNGNRVSIGIYIVVTEVFSLDGTVMQFKNAVVVGTR